MATLLLFNLFWLTLPQNATRIIGYIVSQLSELDLFLDTHYDDMVKYAKANPEGSLELPEFPVSLTLPCADVATMSKSELRAHTLQEASKGIYLQGWAAKDEAREGSSSFLERSIAAADFLGHKGHRWLQILLPLTAAISLLFAITLAYFSHEFTKLVILGVGFCAASLLSLLAFLGATFAITTVSSNREDPFVHNLVELALSLLRLLQRSYVIFFSLGLAFIIMGFIGNLLLRGLRRPA
jgi:hypothetical protein